MDRLRLATDPLGNTTTFTYDALNRLVKKTYDDESYVAYSYDANGNMTEASDGTIAFEFTYDAENKVIKVRDEAQGLEVEYAYDANGNLLWIEDTANNKINYYYDALNRVTNIANGSTFAAIEYATCCSIRTKLTLGNGAHGTRIPAPSQTARVGSHVPSSPPPEAQATGAAARRRLTKITNKRSDGTVISSWDYAYDAVGNVTSQTDKDSQVTSYTYDDVYRLTHVDYPSGSDYGYEYDAVGNRTKMFEYTTSSTITTTYTYDNADELTQWVTSEATVSFTYASDGCLSTKSDGTDTWTYEWDYERRLKAFKKNGSTLVEYAYNPTGTRRYASDATLGVTNYFWSRGHVLGDYSSNWSLTRSYVLGPRVDEIIAMIDRTTDPNVTRYFTRDRLGSTRELLNSSENVATRYSYDAWSVTSEDQLVGNVSTRYRAGGLEYLGDEFYAKRKRMYDPSVGRDVQANFDYTMLFTDGGRYDGPGPRLGLFGDWRCCAKEGAFFADHCGSAPGYCNVWKDFCNASCNANYCDNRWGKALCFRACRCYFKRCWNACAEGWHHGMPPPLGPPKHCKFPGVGAKCSLACGTVDYDRGALLPRPCDDEFGNNQWDTICRSHKNVFEEYGSTVPLTGMVLIDLHGARCKACKYRGVGYYNGGKIVGFCVWVALGPNCPTNFPKNISRYWADEVYWNSSCSLGRHNCRLLGRVAE